MKQKSIKIGQNYLVTFTETVLNCRFTDIQAYCRFYFYDFDTLVSLFIS